MMIKKTKKANSLIEVLIVLGIISTVMVAGVSLIIRNIAQLKVNEIEDIATGVMVKGMELSKSPSEIKVSNDSINILPFDNTLYYSLQKDGDQNILNLENEDGLDDCEVNSKYKVETEIEDDNENKVRVNVCLQIQITPKNGTNNVRFYEIVSRVVYQVPGDLSINSMRGFRYEDFKL